ncbi:MAG: response regulator [Oceanospirillaceae bacterium]|nr:response regulator [Oceanospirillaceae bacterium]
MSELPAILCVDDESNVLSGLKRILFEHFEVSTALGGAEALVLMGKTEFSVVISDMRMPKMNGAEFLSKARKMSPDTTRVLLTGQSEMAAAILAINEGNIFRFLMKPCPEETLIKHINEAVRLHNLLKSEKNLLEKTLKGSIRILTDTLGIVAPNAFSRSMHIKKYVSYMARGSKKKNIWEFEIAAMLSQMGAIVLPPELLQKAFGSISLDEREQNMLDTIPAAGAKLVESIPRLENVAAMIAGQASSDVKIGQNNNANVPFGARMLRIANAADQLIMREELNMSGAVKQLKSVFLAEEDQALLDILETFKHKPDDSLVLKAITVDQLQAGMILNENVMGVNGGVVLCKGQELNGPLIDRLRNFAHGSGLVEPFQVQAKG